MSRTVAEQIAIESGDVAGNPDIVHKLKPSQIMLETGAIWDPEFFLADTSTGVIYRREQFEVSGMMPVELLVCDRRFFSSELESMCELANLNLLQTLPVALKNWDKAIEETDPRAKELLCIGSAL